MFVKICGLTTAEDSRHAVRSGADAVGIVHYEPSPRHADHEQSVRVAEAARETFAEHQRPAHIVLVVFDTPAVAAAWDAIEIGANVLQLHGNYNAEDVAAARDVFSKAPELGAEYAPRQVWWATSLKHHPQVESGQSGEDVLLIDAAVPGSGSTWDLAALEHAKLAEPWLLAGGLNPANVAQAVADAQPWGVDVSSGVESERGIKSMNKIAEFIHNAKTAHARLNAGFHAANAPEHGAGIESSAGAGDPSTGDASAEDTDAEGRA